MKKILNIYIKRPLLWDIIIIILVCYSIHIASIQLNFNALIDIELTKSIFSDLVNSSISLAGFVLASLTIIVTFKANLGHNKNEQKENGISLLFSSKHYTSIVGVFTWAVLIFLSLFVLLSVGKIFVSKFPSFFNLYFCIIPISLTALTIFRTILLLYSIIKLQLVK